MIASSATLKSGSQFSHSLRTKMMQDYRAIAPVHPGGAITAVRNDKGLIDVFSLGSDKKTLFAFVKNEEAGAGWAQTLVDSDPYRVQALASNLIPPNSQSAYLLAVHHTYLLNMAKTSGSAVPTFTIGPNIGAFTFTTHLLPASFQISKMMGFFDDREADGSTGTGRLLTVKLKSKSGSEDDNKIIVFPQTGNIKDGSAYGLVFGSGVESFRPDKIICISNKDSELPADVDFIFMDKGVLGLATSEKVREMYHLVVSTPEFFPAVPGTVVDFAIVTDADDEIHLFVLCDVDGKDALYTATFSVQSGPPTQWQEIASLSDEADRPHFKAVTAFVDGKGHFQLLLTDDDSQLWHCADDITGSAHPWSLPVPLGVDAALVTAALNGEGTLEIFAAGFDGRLRQLWQDDETDWHVTVVDAKSIASAEPSNIFTTALGVIDDVGRPASGFSVDVSSPEAAQVLINGNPHFLEPNVPVPAAANVFGEIKVAMVIDDSLYAPSVVFEAEAFAGGKLEVRPDESAYGYFETLTDDELLAAKDPLTGEPVIPEDKRDQVADVRNVITKATGMAKAAYAPAPNLPESLSRLRDRRGVRFHEAGAVPTKPKLSHADALHAGSWQFGRSDTGAFHAESLTAAAFAQRLALAQPREERLAALQAVGSSGLFGIDWGDVWQAIKNGAAKAFTILIEGTKAVIEFVLEGVKFIWDFVVDELEQVWDIIGGIFDALGTALGTVVGWLLDVVGFFFDWKGAIEPARQAVFSLLTETVEQELKKIDLSSTKKEVRSWVEKTLTLENFESNTKNVGGKGDTKVANMVYKPAESPASIFGDDGNSPFDAATWLVDKATEFIPQLDILPTPIAIPELKLAVEKFEKEAKISLDLAAASFVPKLSKTLEGFIENVGDVTKFEEESLDGILAMFADLVKILREIALTAIDSVFELIESVVALVPKIIDAFSQPIDIPFISAFYKQIFDRDLTLLDLACLILAIPISILDGLAGGVPGAADGITLRSAVTLGAVCLMFWSVLNLVAEYLDLTVEQPRLALFMTLIADFIMIPGVVLGFVKVPGWTAMATDERFFWAWGA